MAVSFAADAFNFGRDCEDENGQDLMAALRNKI